MKKILASLLGKIFAGYIKCVYALSRKVNNPAKLLDETAGDMPAIFTFWHGEHFLIPPAWNRYAQITILASRSADGEIQASAMRSFGLDTVRGSGGRNRAKTVAKGGIKSSVTLLKSLKDGSNIAMTANVPKGEARRVGKGVVTLAKLSGRPVIPLSCVTGANIYLSSWDKATINLPFSKVAVCLGQPIYVDSAADEDALEQARQRIEQELIKVTTSANALAQ